MLVPLLLLLLRLFQSKADGVQAYYLSISTVVLFLAEVISVVDYRRHQLNQADLDWVHETRCVLWDGTGTAQSI